MQPTKGDYVTKWLSWIWVNYRMGAYNFTIFTPSVLASWRWINAKSFVLGKAKIIKNYVAEYFFF